MAPSAAVALAVALGIGAGQAGAATILNGGFEEPSLGTGTRFSFVSPNLVDGWETTDSAIEIWANGFQGVTSYRGTQHAEINARAFGTLSQIVSGIDAGADLALGFAHRARQGTDTMRVDVVDLGADGTASSADDTTLFSRDFSATTAAWIYTDTSSFADITARGGDIRVSFTAVSTGSGSVSVGNFLDEVALQAEISAVPGPAAGGLLISALGALALWRRRRAA